MRTQRVIDTLHRKDVENWFCWTLKRTYFWQIYFQKFMVLIIDKKNLFQKQMMNIIFF